MFGKRIILKISPYILYTKCDYKHKIYFSMERDKKGQSIKNNKKLLLNILTIQKDIGTYLDFLKYNLTFFNRF